jgi:hypothetical protein
MLVNATVALEILRCIRESDESGHSDPYIWPELLAISPSAQVTFTAPAVENARVVIKKDMRAGDVADIPTSVGAIGMQVDDASLGLILAVTLLEADDGPDHAIKAAFQAYVSGVPDAIQTHLAELNNPATRDAAVAAIKQEVQNDVTTAFGGNLTLFEKIKIFILGIENPDDVIDSDFQSFSPPFVPTQFTLRFGPDRGGRLLSYGDAGTPGNVSAPVVVGFGGWSDFKFFFAGRNAAGENRIYAVDQAGQLLSYGDAGTPGNVSAPVVVGFGGWSDFKFLFAGRNAVGENRIYAVDQAGQLLSYGDAGTPGNVSAPVVVGLGGWSDFKFLFAGRNVAGADRIYAVDQDGQLLSYGDAGTPGNVSAPVVVGFGGWSDFKFLAAGRNVAGEDRVYAVDKFVQSQNDFEIEGNLQVSPIIIERDEVKVTTAA